MSSQMGADSAKPNTDWEAVARYLAGESPTAEREAIQAWLAQHPDESRVIAGLDQTLDRLTLNPADLAGIDVEGALARVNARRAEQVQKPMGRTLEFRSRRSAWIPMIAAAAILIIAVTYVLRARPEAASPAGIAARTFTTSVGGRDSLRLPDGTTVILGPDSRLTLAANYGTAERRLTLRGEAYFDVVHDVAHPFTIVANGAVIRDVGTSFGVHADSTGDVRVTVKSGSVELARATDSTATTVLAAGDVGTVPATGAVVTQRGALTDDDLAWTKGTLVFRDATIAEVRDDLKRWYGIELIADASVMQRHLTATFTAKDSITAVLRNIALSLPATIERRGDTAVIRAAATGSRRK
ncbi:MAG TPA: FecR domain-containing protein [Gemmatimonadaceae bacterium]